MGSQELHLTKENSKELMQISGIPNYQEKDSLILANWPGYPNCEKTEVGKNIIRKIFYQYQGSTKKYGGSFSVVYLPDTRFYFKKWPDCEYEMVSSLCNELNISFLDMVKVFNKFKNPKEFLLIIDTYQL